VALRCGVPRNNRNGAPCLEAWMETYRTCRLTALDLLTIVHAEPH
jgi:hypothetical protein